MLRKFWIGATVLLLVAGPIARGLLFDSDHAVANIVMVGFLLLAGLSAWLLLLSSKKLHRSAKLGIVLFPIVCTALLAAMFRFVGFSGEMVPEFEFRFKSKKSTVITTESNEVRENGPHLKESNLNEASTTFTQFFGSNRNGNIPSIRFHPDWTANPPKILWKRPIGAGWAGFAVRSERAVSIEQDGDQECIHCFNVNNGDTIWKKHFAGRHFNVLGGLGPRSTPTIEGSVVYVQSAVDAVRALKLEDGELLWESSILKILNLSQTEAEQDVAWGRSGSPLVIDDLVIVPLGGKTSRPIGGIVALERDTGRVAWQGGDDQISYSSPAIMTLAGVKQVVIVNEKTVSGHSLDSGDTLWSFPWPGQSNGSASVSQPIAVDADHLFVSKGYGGGAAVHKLSEQRRQWTCEQVWADRTLMKTKFTSPIFHKQSVFGLSDGVLECIDPFAGKRKWKSPKGRYGHGQLLLVGDHLLVLSEEGELILLEANPEQFVELGRMKVLDGKTWNIPAVFDNRVLVRNSTEVACIEVRLADTMLGTEQ